jgi:2-amino-4-hydroxy-6-hydroxymethyldihydropteridine diphosphokinase
MFRREGSPVLQRDPVLAYIGLGANLGDAQKTLLHALRILNTTPGILSVVSSGFYSTQPVDAEGPDYVNAVAEVQTRLNAMSLLKVLQELECAAGRQRPYRNAPRTLDLDILLYGSARIDSPSLTVPHPRMTERAFVMVPLAIFLPCLEPILLNHGISGGVKPFVPE